MLFSKLWNVLRNRDHLGMQHREKPAFRPQVEMMEQRVVPTQLPTPAAGIISGQVFFDSNKNGVLDTGEHGAQGVTVTLSGKTTQSADVKVSTTTDADGKFTFSQLSAGTYTLVRTVVNTKTKEVTQATGRNFAGNLGGSMLSTSISNITLGEGQVATNYVFALQDVAPARLSLRQFLNTTRKPNLQQKLGQLTAGSGKVVFDKLVDPNTGATLPTAAASTLTGTVFDDTDNKDGVQNGAEAGISGAQLALTGLDDTGKAVFLQQTTDSEGAYTFNVTRPGNYTLQLLSPPSGFRAGSATPGSLGGLSTIKTQVFGIAVAAGSAATDYDFGEIASAAPTANASKPVLVAELVDQTGGFTTDTVPVPITADPSIQGSIVSSVPIATLNAGFNTPSTVIKNALGAGGKFYLNLAQLQQVAGGTLTQGTHTLHLQAFDAKGRASAVFDLTFQFDNEAPTTPTLVLDPTFDDGTANNDGRTSLDSVTLTGVTSATDTQVQLFQGSSNTPLATATPDGDGKLSFTNVTLNSGVNDFVVRAVDSAGNLSQFTNFFVRNQAPTVNAAKPLEAVTVNENAAPTTIDLANKFLDADRSDTIVRLNTNYGLIDIEMLDTATPQTVANFLNYVTSNSFDSTIFHRLVSKFVLQGGGFKFDSASSTKFTALTPDPAVDNEFDASRSNVFGTLAMAKQPSDPNSATDQFFFNLNNNSANLDSQNGGFTVFARVLSGADMRVVNTMATTPVKDESATNSAFGDTTATGAARATFPVKNLTGTFPGSVTKDNLLVINAATIARQTEALTYTASSDNEGLVKAEVKDNRLTLTYVSGQTGSATITVTATDKSGVPVSTTFNVTVNA